MNGKTQTPRECTFRAGAGGTKNKPPMAGSTNRCYEKASDAVRRTSYYSIPGDLPETESKQPSSVTEIALRFIINCSQIQSPPKMICDGEASTVLLPGPSLTEGFPATNPSLRSV